MAMFSGELNPLGGSRDLNKSPKVVWTSTGPSETPQSSNPDSCVLRKLTVRSWNDQTQFRRNNHTGNWLFMSSQSGSWCWYLAFSNYRLGSCVPVPQKNRTIGRTRSDVTVRSDVAFGSGQAGHHAIVAEDDLDDFRTFRGENSETVIPEPARD